MSGFGNMKVTDAGHAMLAQAMQGAQITFTKVEIGDGAKSTGYESTTQLVHFLYALPLQSVLRSGQKVTVTSEVANSGLEQGYYLRETALYAHAGTGAEAIFAYDNAGDGAICIPSGSSNVSMDGRLRFAFQISESSNVTINTTGLQFAAYDHRHDNSTAGADGFMSAADKQKLDSRLGQAVNQNSSPTFAGATIGGIVIDGAGVAHGMKYEA